MLNISWKFANAVIPSCKEGILNWKLACRVQKRSRLHCSEPEANFALHVVFEEDLEICINNPISAKFSYNATSTVKGIAYSQLKLP